MFQQFLVCLVYRLCPGYLVFLELPVYLECLVHLEFLAFLEYPVYLEFQFFQGLLQS